MHFSKIILISTLFLASCSQPTETESPITSTTVPFDRSQVLQIVDRLNQHATANKVELSKEINALNGAAIAFLNNPNDEQLLVLQQQWQSAHDSYARAQFGFLTLNDESRELIYRIDAWPVQPGFIDDLPAYPESGIINDETLALSAEVLISQHGITDEEEVSLGFHSMEYLIFARPLSDFAEESNLKNVKRRRQFLSIVAHQLVEDTESMIAACEGQFDVAGYTEALSLLNQVLSGNLQKLRLAFRESNLMTAKDEGHSTFSGTSLLTLQSEIESLELFMITAVPMESILRAIDPNAYANFKATLLELDQLLKDSAQDEVSRANLPLLLSALIHEMESFDRMLIHQLPPN